MLFQLSQMLWPVFAPSQLLEIIVAVACYRAIAGSRRARLTLLAATAALLLAAVLPLGGWLLTPLESRFPTWQPPPSAAFDGIIALGGDTGHRVEELARASRFFPNATLIYSGRGDRRAAETEIRQVGLDPARVVIESSSRTTLENAADTAHIVKPTPGERWLLITSAAHMPRAIGCFRHAGFRVTADPVDPHTDPTSFIYARTAAQRVAQLNDAAREWIGLLAYRVAGKTDVLFPGP